MLKPFPSAAHARGDAVGLAQSMTHPLAAALHALIADPMLADTFRVTFDAELHGCNVDWPRYCAQTDLTSWLRPTDVLIELTRTPAREPFELALLLHTQSATRVIERVLGAPVSSAMPSLSGAPSDAECGVLAYAAARIIASRPLPFVVRDVRVDPLAGPLPESLMLWPLALETSFGKLDGMLLCSRALASGVRGIHSIEVLVRDAPDRGQPFTASVGDVWISDRWLLTDTTEGLAGSVLLGTPGAATELHARLAGPQLVATGPAPTTAPDQLELVLAQLPLPLSALADLVAGLPQAITPIAATAVQLRRGAAMLAEGELVTYRGAVGVRITAT